MNRPGHSASSACQLPSPRSCSCGIADEPPRPIAARLGELRDLSLAEQRDVATDLAERAAQQAHFAAQSHPFVPLRVPGAGRTREPELVGHARCHRGAALTHDREAAHRTAQLQLQRASRCVAQAPPRPQQRSDPGDRPQTETDDQGRLHQRAVEHWRIAVPIHQRQQRVDQCAQARVEGVAALDTFEITAQGFGSHAAMPEQGVDPLIVVAQIVMGLQKIPSRVLAPRHSTWCAGAATRRRCVDGDASLSRCVPTYAEWWPRISCS
jgi:hypothetical protein